MLITTHKNGLHVWKCLVRSSNVLENTRTVKKQKKKSESSRMWKRSKHHLKVMCNETMTHLESSVILIIHYEMHLIKFNPIRTNQTIIVMMIEQEFAGKENICSHRQGIDKEMNLSLSHSKCLSEFLIYIYIQKPSWKCNLVDVSTVNITKRNALISIYQPYYLQGRAEFVLELLVLVCVPFQWRYKSIMKSTLFIYINVCCSGMILKQQWNILGANCTHRRFYVH